MLENLHFTYDGKSSKDFGVVLVNPSGGLYKEQFLPNRKIVETTVAGRYNPFLQRVDSDPLSFSLHIYMPEWEERNNLRQISRWLYQDYYKPLRFESNPDVIYYAILEGKSELTHNGLFQGYISLTVRLDSPFMYSPIHPKEFTVNGRVDFPIYNNGDLPMSLNIEFTKHEGDDHIYFINDDVASQDVWIENILPNEIVYYNGEIESVTSSLESQGRYLIDNHNDHWIIIEPETSNNIVFFGNYHVKLSYQYRYLNVDIEMYKGGFCG